MDTTPEAPQPRISRRRKIAIACENCRTKKIRCNGERPVCQCCLRRGAACRYTASLVPWDRTRQHYVKELEKKLDAWERRAASAEHEKPSPPRNGIKQSSRDNGAQLFLSHSDPSDLDYQGNGLSKAGGHGPLPDLNPLHMGQSCSETFLQGVLTLIQGPASRPVLTLRELGSHKFTTDASAADFSLPPREVALDLLDTYWREHFYLYPAVHWAKFQVEYDQLCTGVVAAEDVGVLHCWANFMFALATRSMRRVSEADRHDATQYFHRATRLMNLDIFGGYSFRLIQALVLCAQYLESTGDPSRYWTIATLAIRAARMLGLHLPATSQNLHLENEQHLARWLWQCCLNLDRSLSMALGRQPMVSLEAGAAIVPTFRHRERVTAESRIRQDHFIHSCRLFDIVQDILSSFYKESVDIVPLSDIATHTPRLEGKLDDWADTLPLSLRLSQDEPATQHAHFMWQRFLHVRMMMFRAGLSSAISARIGSLDASSTLKAALAWHCATKCIDAANRILDMAILQLQIPAEILTIIPWWYTVQYTCDASATLLGARLSPQVSEGVGIDILDRGLGHCIQLLTHYGDVHPPAARCLAQLSSMVERTGCTIPSSEVILEGHQATDIPVDPTQNIDFEDGNWLDLSWFNASLSPKLPPFDDSLFPGEDQADTYIW
ncbi:hypothetical protein LTR93_011422 [Exophiala xenobiotica]|nr:hypothetical protein LTR93_011422 [Exophiala xenobiotica]